MRANDAILVDSGNNKGDLVLRLDHVTMMLSMMLSMMLMSTVVL